MKKIFLRNICKLSVFGGSALGCKQSIEQVGIEKPNAIVKKGAQGNKPMSGPTLGTSQGEWAKAQYFPLKEVQSFCAAAGGGMGAFGAGRPGRLHAACDMYAANGIAVYAVADGEVIQNEYPFSAPTTALEIDHGTFTIRYGEIKAGSARFKQGDKVRAGEEIALVGLTNVKRDQPMLHFEYYSNTATGPLTQKGVGKYERRSDLQDPTDFSQKLSQDYSK